MHFYSSQYLLTPKLESLSSTASRSQRSTSHDDDDAAGDSADDFENVTSTVTVPLTICLMIIIG